MTALHRAAGEGHEEAGSETERPTGKCKAGSKGGERLSLQHYFIPSFSTSLLQHGLRYMLKSLSSNIAHLRSAQPGELGKQAERWVQVAELLLRRCQELGLAEPLAVQDDLGRTCCLVGTWSEGLTERRGHGSDEVLEL